MSDPIDPLEAELAGLQPRAPSPELRNRVAARLGASRARPWRWALAGVVVLVAILAVAIPWTKEPPPVPPSVQPPPPAAAKPESPAPSVLAYQRALAQSPAAFDALLDQQPATNPGPVATASFSRSAAALDAFLGDD